MLESSELEFLQEVLEHFADPILVARKKEIVRYRQLVLIHRHRKQTLLELEGGRTVETKEGLTALARKLPPRFLVLGKEWILDLERIQAVSGGEERRVGGQRTRAPYRLHLEGWPDPIEIPKRLEAVVRRRLGVQSLDHPTPALPSERLMREKGLVDFGYSEWVGMNPEDPAQEARVEAFRKKWELGRWSPERILEHFGIPGKPNQIDEWRFVRNVVWQRYTWIKRGILPRYQGNVRSLWYEVESAVDRHEVIEMQVSGNRYSDLLIQLTGVERLLRYRDIGFFDMRSAFRRIGQKHPNVILMGEKEGDFPKLRTLARPHGITFACTKGQASRIMVEYLLQELSGEEKPEVTDGPSSEPPPRVDLGRDWIHIFALSDFDWAGKAIVENFAQAVAYETGSDRVVLHRLVTRQDLSDEDIEFGRSKAAQYRLHGRAMVPIRGTKKRALDKVYAWWVEEGSDPRFRTVRRDPQGVNVYTLWKVSLNKVDWKALAARLEERIRPVLDGTWDGSTGERVRAGRFVPGIPADEGLGEAQAKAQDLAPDWHPYERILPYDDDELD